MGAEDKKQEALKEKAIERLKEVYDPEIPVNIYDLGLIYKIEVQPAKEEGYSISIEMTLTTPNCPMAGIIPRMVHDSLAKIDDLKQIRIELVWEPVWTPEKMTEEARVALDMF